MKVLTAAEMQAVDRRAIDELGIPGPVLMENAAAGVTDALLERFPHAADVAVLAGPGNNGGDGLAVARLLDGRGVACRVFLVLRSSPPRGDAALQLQILERAGIEVVRVTPETSLEPVLAACRQADVVVDALFGTGLSRPLAGHFAGLIDGVAACGTPVLAVDLPSGLDASRHQLIGPCLAAELTVTFALPKVAHLLPPAAERIGELVVADLGLPRRLLEEAEASLHLLLAEELAPLLPPRAADGHKGRFGHVLIVAGAPGTAGAAVLAARAALRGGAGLVTCAVPAPLQPLVDGASLESMTLA
ncbi:MAG: NAD(P)H-hydrate epimerase, partial [Acidobacteria bacterium]